MAISPFFLVIIIEKVVILSSFGEFVKVSLCCNLRYKCLNSGLMAVICGSIRRPFGDEASIGV